MIKLDFTEHIQSQDMIKLIERDKRLSTKEAIDFSINTDNYSRIIATGWAHIALPLWGHGEAERDWYVIDNPCLEIELGEHKLSLINQIVKRYNIDIETAVAYFLLFTMESLGYHI